MAAPAQVDNGPELAVGWLFAFVLPPVAFIIGLTQINRGGGLAIVVTSVWTTIAWCIALLYLL